MERFPAVTLKLPDWIDEIARPGEIFVSLEERMRFVISLAARNIERGTGGPFGAAVFEVATGALIAPGVNIVVPQSCSVAHAEALALMVAQKMLGTFDLGAPGMPNMELITTAQPCIQCFGNVWWSGIKRLVTGASTQQTEAIAGFSEGPVPLDWAELLRDRKPSIEVIEGVLADEACQVLQRYKESGGYIYNPDNA